MTDLGYAIGRIVDVLLPATEALVLLSGGWLCPWCEKAIMEDPCPYCGGSRDGAETVVYDPVTPEQLEEFLGDMEALARNIVEGEP